jgi:hypothetical protein
MNDVQQQLQQVWAQLAAAMVAKNATQLRRQLWAQYNALKAQAAAQAATKSAD